MKYLLVFLLGCSLFVWGCVQPWRPLDEPLEDDQELITETYRILNDQGKGKYWKAVYYPDSVSYGAYKVLIHFKGTGSADVYSEDERYYRNTVDKEKDQDVQYQIIPGIKDRLIFLTYSVLHELYDKKRGEFEFYIQEFSEDSVLLRSYTDGLANTTHLKLYPSSLDYLDTLRFEKGYHSHNVGFFSSVYLNTMFYVDRVVDVPVYFDPVRRVMVFTSEILGSEDEYENFSYPYRLDLAIEGVNDTTAHISLLGDPEVVIQSQTYYFPKKLRINQVDRSTKEGCTKEELVVGVSWDGLPSEFVFQRKASRPKQSLGIETLFKRGIALTTTNPAGTIAYGGKIGRIGGLEDAPFLIERVNLQINWKGYNNCGSVLAIRSSPVWFNLDLRLLDINSEFIRLGERVKGGAFEVVNNEATDPAWRSQFPVPEGIEFFNVDGSSDPFRTLMFSKHVEFFMNVDKVAQNIVMTSLCHDFLLAFNYIETDTSCLEEDQ
ncbi:MAG: DUF4302 domain-containing protein [Cytophagales bacterium]|nr:DUF4302 domain-containing protein [Cytophagales bacterium]